MDIAVVRSLLDSLPDRSDYEWKNFEIEAQGGIHRQIRYALLQFEQLSDEIDVLDAEIKIDQLSMKAKQEGDAKIKKQEANIVHSRIQLKSRQLKKLHQRLRQVTAWLEQNSTDDIEHLVANFEKYESDNWSEMLGRTMGVELLADNHTSPGTMAKVSLLPVADYKKAVMITNQLNYFLRRTAENVEKASMPNQPSGLSGDNEA